MSNLDELLAAVETAPDDWTPRLVMADWLEEQGESSAETIRIIHQLLQESDSNRDAGQHRLQELTANGTTCPGPRRTTLLNGELVLLPPGAFLMGDSDSGRVPVVLSQGFWIGRTQVTQQQWATVMGPSKNWSHLAPEHPATHLHWEDANAFCARLTEMERGGGVLAEGWEYALPTEAQWEFACRAGTRSPYYFGEDWAQLVEHAWFNRNTTEAGEEYIHPVGKKRPNPWGLFDLYGNVLEWCRDGFAYDHEGGTDPCVEPESTTRVTRGGDFRSADWCCESGSRFEYVADERRDDIGLRLVLRRAVA